VAPTPIFHTSTPVCRSRGRCAAALASARGRRRTIYPGNHGLVAVGASAQEVLQITAMAVKAARILLVAYAAGGPAFMPDDEVGHIDSRRDEHYRRDVLARGRL
jgi:ribulose-5-phosphate 4-epimerase/fuculose-1-phosphate aldolase